jgi:hypothetical protein
MSIGGNPKSWAQKTASSSDETELQENGIIRLGTNLLDKVETVWQSAEYQAALAALPANSLFAVT